MGKPMDSNVRNEKARTFAKVVTRSAFLHVEDALAISKLHLWIGQYTAGSGCQKHASAYLDLDAARVIFGDLLLRGGLPPTLYPDQKVEFYGGSTKEGQVQARVLRFREDVKLKSPIVIEISTGPGRKSDHGAIQPTGKMETVSIYLDVWSARKLAASVLAALQAWDLLQELAARNEKQEVGGPFLQQTDSAE